MLLTKLKQATQPFHQRLEASPFSIDLMRGAMSLGQYTQLLETLYGFYAPIEQRIGQIPGWQSIGLDFEPRRKSAWIAQDLRVLGVDAAAIDTLPCCADLPAIDTLPQALGCLYVLEGATLGGQVISRQIKRMLNLGPEDGARFYSSYAAQLGSMWKAFCDAANRYAAAHDVDQIVLASACESFLKLEQWMNAPVALAVEK